MTDYTEFLNNFKSIMLERLRNNDHKAGWRCCNPIDLYTGILTNAADLALAIEYDDLPKARNAAADLANYAAMIVSNMEAERV